jgi:hypothetical protein
VSAYQCADSYPSSCPSQLRACTYGQLSGTFIRQQCCDSRTTFQDCIADGECNSGNCEQVSDEYGDDWSLQCFDNDCLCGFIDRSAGDDCVDAIGNAEYESNDQDPFDCEGALKCDGSGPGSEHCVCPNNAACPAPKICNLSSNCVPRIGLLGTGCTEEADCAVNHSCNMGNHTCYNADYQPCANASVCLDQCCLSLGTPGQACDGESTCFCYSDEDNCWE